MCEATNNKEDKYYIPTTQSKFADFSLNEQKIIRQLDIIRMLSPAIKKKVGAIIGDAHTGETITIGYNQMFQNIGNQQCEDSDNISYPWVQHAEEQAVIDFLKRNLKRDTSKLTMYVSYSPCILCAKLTAYLGIHRLVFVDNHEFKFDRIKYSPRQFLELAGFEVIQVIY